MNNIIFGVLVYLIIGCVLCLIDWLSNSDSIIETATSMCTRQGWKRIDILLISAGIFGMIMWPFALVHSIFK